ncbi:transposase [Kitasatospora sp. NBC_00070]|uniref:transposase n=1 Tax=Kitasatospora sp. NBC_00070 TaxID=2975962 RepID=UPI00386013E8
MARPSKCSAEFRSDAIAWWRASDGRRRFRAVAADLNVNPETLRTWVRDAHRSAVASGASQDSEAELARLRGRTRGRPRPSRNGGSSGRSCAGHPPKLSLAA